MDKSQYNEGGHMVLDTVAKAWWLRHHLRHTDSVSKFLVQVPALLPIQLSASTLPGKAADDSSKHLAASCLHVGASDGALGLDINPALAAWRVSQWTKDVTLPVYAFQRKC